MRWRINKPALRGIITMLGGTTADAARLMAATSSLFMCIESRQRFILRPRPPNGGYGRIREMFGAAAPELATEGLFPVRNSAGVAPWVQEGSFDAFDSYMERSLEEDPNEAYAGLMMRAHAASRQGGYGLAHAVSWPAFGIAAREVLRNSLSRRIEARYGDRIYIPLQMTVPCLACCIVGQDEDGCRQAKALADLFVSGYLPIGRFRCGDSWAFLTSI